MASVVYMGTEPLVLKKKALVQLALKPCSAGLET